MSINEEEVRYIAHLSRLKLDDQEEKRLAGELSGILDFVSQLQEVDVEGVDPYISAANLDNVFREDEPHEPLNRDKALQNAPHHSGEGFLVPKVVDSGAGA